MKKRIILWAVVSGVLFAALCPSHALAESLNWKVLETRYVKLYYLSRADLEMFDKKIDYEDNSQGFGFFGNKKSGGNLDEELIKKMDSLYERVQAILDMRRSMKKVTVKIYGNKNTLWNSYQEIYKKRRELRAWYIFEYHTIYVNREDLNEGMLAHEIAHSVIDHFLEVRPPSATAEILARYVDMHLVER